MPAHTSDPAENVRLIVLDVDGVMTDGGIILDANGIETKRFHVRDGTGLKLWMGIGGSAAIITGRSGKVVEHRARELGIELVRQGVVDKAAVLREIAAELRVPLAEVAVIGDDIPDLMMMQAAGYPVAVADAVAEIRGIARFVTTRPGGSGAVREAIEHVLKVQRRWDEAVAGYVRYTATASARAAATNAGRQTAGTAADDESTF